MASGAAGDADRPLPFRAAGPIGAGTLTPNSRISRKRYVRWSPSARAARVRLPPHWQSVASINRRLNSVTAP